MQLTKVEQIKVEGSARLAFVESLVVEKPFLERRFKINSIIPYAGTEAELGISASTTGFNGIVMPTPLTGKILEKRRQKLFQTNLNLESIEQPTVDLLSKAVIADNSTDWVFYRNGWEHFEPMLKQANLTEFTQDIQKSFDLEERGSNPDLQVAAWNKLIANERSKIGYTRAIMRAQSLAFPFYLSNGLPMLHRDMPELVDACVELDKTGQTLAKTYGKPYQLSLTINQTALRSSKFIGQFIKRVREESIFGTEFESIAFKLPNENIHGSSIERENFSKLLDLCKDIRALNKTAALLNVDPALALVSLQRGIDLVGVPLGGNTRFKQASLKEKRGGGSSYGRYLNMFTLEYLGKDDILEMYEQNDYNMPHHCNACIYLEGMRLKVTAPVWNQKRKEHAAEGLSSLSKQSNNELERNDGSLWAGVQDRIDRSNYQNYRSLIRKPMP